MKTKIGAVALAATFAMGMALAATADAKEFRYATGQDILGLDPHINNHGGTNAMKVQIYEPLVHRHPDLSLHPALATDWQQTSPTVWRFNLRKGVKFHGGEDFTADDVIFSWKRTSQPESEMAYTVRTVKDIRKIDDHTIEIETTGPDPVLLQNLTLFIIMDEGWTTKNGGEKVVRGAQVNTFVNLNANGTGPFRLVERAPDTRTVLEANAAWWGKGANSTNITKATFTPIANAATRVSALLSGDLDLMYHVPQQDVQRLEQTQGVRVQAGGTARVIFLGFDHFRDELLDMPGTGKNPLKDVRVRKALYQAIDINQIRRAVMRNSSTPNGLMIAPGVGGFQEDMNQRFPFDAEASKKLLAEAGYPNGFPLTLNCPNNRYVNDEAICSAIIPMFARIGIQAKLNAMPMNQHFNTAGPAGGYKSSMYMLGWTPANMDLSNPLVEILAFDEKVGLVGANNWGRYNNPKLNDLTKQVLVETDQTKRNQLARDAMKVIVDDVAYIPLHLEPQVFGVRDTVADFQMRRHEDVDLRFVKMK
ncbi:MAG TPA: ABC transporter substrate-binding protein [Azospirillaceae bacterium]|nr:ABC transporter substrate-binding protein [Azospirillaceae bacterium]